MVTLEVPRSMLRITQHKCGKGCCDSCTSRIEHVFRRILSATLSGRGACDDTPYREVPYSTEASLQYQREGDSLATNPKD